MPPRLQIPLHALALALALTLTTSGAPITFAQTPQAPGSRMGMMSGDTSQMMSMMRSMMTMMGAQSGMMLADIEGQIASLKTELKIAQDQAPQWNRFADALRASAKSMNGMFQQMMQPGTATTLFARLDRQEAMLTSHLSSVKALKETLEPLYASFSDEQKKIADSMMIGPMGMM